jgi:hypothetical protein
MRIGSVLLIIWLAIGAVAGGQRHYYNGPVNSCVKAGTIALTIVAGPLNYFGVLHGTEAEQVSAGQLDSRDPGVAMATRAAAKSHRMSAR